MVLNKISKFIKGLVFLGISLTFFSATFYNIHRTIFVEGVYQDGTELGIYQWSSLSAYFDLFFEKTNTNIILAILFGVVGILEIIGGIKNGD